MRLYADQTGVEVFEGHEVNFTWQADATDLRMYFEENAELSLLHEVLEWVVHGEPIEFFRYSLSESGQTLTLADSHDHGHLELVFTRIG